MLDIHLYHLLDYYGMSSTRIVTVLENTSYIIATMDKENIDKSYITDTDGNILWSPFGSSPSILLGNESLPSYYNAYIGDKIEKINQLSLVSSRRCDDFIFITDMHIEVNYMQSPKLIKHKTNNTINNNIIGDELNNNIATADNMVETFYGNNAESNSPTVPYEKDEMRKRLIMKMSSSLPWGFMEEELADVKLEAKRRMEEEKIKTSSDEAE